MEHRIDTVLNNETITEDEMIQEFETGDFSFVWVVVYAFRNNRPKVIEHFWDRVSYSFAVQERAFRHLVYFVRVEIYRNRPITPKQLEMACLATRMCMKHDSIKTIHILSFQPIAYLYAMGNTELAETLLSYILKLVPFVDWNELRFHFYHQLPFDDEVKLGIAEISLERDFLEPKTIVDAQEFVVAHENKRRWARRKDLALWRSSMFN